MTLFNIAFKNIKKSFYSYTLYFASMIFSIMIFFTFKSIEYNTQVKALAAGSLKISVAFKACSIVIALFSAIFIWYSNSFFTRKRKKEIGLYSMLGVKKKQIGRMLFYENLLIGVLALAAGILLGALFSKLFTMILVKLMGFNVTIKFFLSLRAILETSIVFFIIFLVTSIHAYTLIYRFKIIDLFTADKSSEKQPKSSAFVAILSILLVGGGYFIYLNPPVKNLLYVWLGTLILVVTGTYLLFSSAIVFIIKLSKRNKKRYFRGINMIGTSQLLYRIRSHSKTLATIAVLSASALVAMSVSYSFYYDNEVNCSKGYPFTYAYYSKDNSISKDFENLVSKYPKNKVLDSVEAKLLNIKYYCTDTSSKKEQVRSSSMHVISESDFKKIAKARGLEDKFTLKENEAALYDSTYYEGFTQSDFGKTYTFKTGDGTVNTKITVFKDYTLTNNMLVYETLIVKDDVFNKISKSGEMDTFKGYITDNKKDSADLDNAFYKLIEAKKLKHASSYYSMYNNFVIVYGLFIFLSAFLGLVFLMATGSIIFFKQLSEANEEKERYRVLRNIGVSSKEIKLSISKQILFVFLLPLLVGIAHNLVALTLIEKVLKTNLTIPICLTIGVYSLIYFIYYMVTVNSYYKIVNTK